MMTAGPGDRAGGGCHGDDGGGEKDNNTPLAGSKLGIP